VRARAALEVVDLQAQIGFVTSFTTTITELITQSMRANHALETKDSRRCDFDA
jgi:hypothetical protein